MKRLIIAASLLFSVSANAAFSDLAVLSAENDIRERAEFLFGMDTMQAYETTNKIKKNLDNVVKVGIRANMSCLLMKREYLRLRNEATAGEFKKGTYAKYEVTIEEVQGFNELKAAYVGARCMQVK